MGCGAVQRRDALRLIDCYWLVYRLLEGLIDKWMVEVIIWLFD